MCNCRFIRQTLNYQLFEKFMAAVRLTFVLPLMKSHSCGSFSWYYSGQNIEVAFSAIWDQSYVAQAICDPPLVSCGFPSQRASDAEPWCFPSCYPQPVVEQVVESPKIWDQSSACQTFCEGHCQSPVDLRPKGDRDGEFLCFYQPYPLSCFSVVVCLRCLLHHILSRIAYTFREDRDFVFFVIVQFMMSANIRIRFDLQIVFICFHITPSHYHDCAKLIWGHWTYKMPVRYILSSVWVRLSIFSQLSIIQYMGLGVFSLPMSLVMIERIYTLSYYHHQIGSMNYYPLFRVRSWNNGMRCMSLYILLFSCTPEYAIEQIVKLSVISDGTMNKQHNCIVIFLFVLILNWGI